jgi:tRNA pseudouridine synthase 8/2,5-diamino-6-(5-phospho-D-ribitylamino)-pyrimidin-4(3H)-one deaminase
LSEEEKKKAKEAKTEIKWMFYDKESDTSVLKCYPKTGRTH